MNYYWLKFAVWYHTNVCFTDTEIQLFFFHLLRKDVAATRSNIEVLAEFKQWLLIV